MPDWRQLASLINFCTAYYTTQLVRCAAFSFVLIGLVMLLRKIFFSERTFLRGMSWALFLVIPFLGRLKMFYKNAAVLKATWRITAVTASWLWGDRIYMAGILVTAICIFGKRIRLQRTVSGMEKVMFENVRIYVTDMNITPFTVGLLKPKIVLPKVMADSYSKDELKSVIQHEQTHIRLGHLWFGFAWDMLRCLLWINPLLTVFQKHFRADMEDICDRVCIQSSRRTAHEYGMVLLKTMKLLRSESETAPPSVTYVGEREFADMKRRMGEIAGFRPYRKRMCAGMAAAAVLVIAALLLAGHTHSYAKCNKDENILVYEYDSEGNAGILDYGSSIHQIISYDDSYVYVDREAFEDFLDKNNVDGDIFIVFGDFYKLPGFSSGGVSCLYETGSDAGVFQIPYQRQTNDWMMTLFKIL